MSVNKVILVGNVGKDPVIRYIDTRPVAELSLATTERAYTAANGTRVEERTEWHRLIMWDSAAETAEKIHCQRNATVCGGQTPHPHLD